MLASATILVARSMTIQVEGSLRNLNFPDLCIVIRNGLDLIRFSNSMSRKDLNSRKNSIRSEISS